MRKNPSEVVDDINKEYDKALSDESIDSFIDDKLMKGELILRAEDIRRDLEANKGIKVKIHNLRIIMKDLLDLRYRNLDRSNL